MMKIKTIFLILLCITMIGWGRSEQSTGESDRAPIKKNVDYPNLEKHIKILSSDEFEGRRPGTPGEEKTVKYISEQFRKLNVKPGNGDSYFQNVSLVSMNLDTSAVMSVKGKNYSADLNVHEKVFAWTRRIEKKVEISESEIVFVGFGIVAPEYNWNDYAGIDVKGKTVVIVRRDPGMLLGDDTLFKGKAMTYYGRRSYKFEEAARQGAAAAILIHEEGEGFPWKAVQRFLSRPRLTLAAKDKNMSRVPVEGVVPEPIVDEWFKSIGTDFKTAKEAALKKGFKAMPLNLKLSISIKNSFKYTDSRNVIGLIPGTQRPDEYIVYMAHWDHLGVNKKLKGDQIYNGALDNASGTAGVIVLAEKFAKAVKNGNAPGRSIVFLCVTAEESGLLGSQFYAENPIYPLKNTVAGLNMDVVNPNGRSKDISVLGYGSSELEKYVKEIAEKQGRYVSGDPSPESGYFYRSDHFSLAKVGVPVLVAKSGIHSVEHGKEWGMKQRQDYVKNRYHKPADEYDSSWNLDGMREDLDLYFEIGWRLASEDTFPNWYRTSEFRAIRDKSRQ